MKINGENKVPLNIFRKGGVGKSRFQYEDLQTLHPKPYSKSLTLNHNLEINGTGGWKGGAFKKVETSFASVKLRIFMNVGIASHRNE